MHLLFWRPSLSGRGAAKRLVASAGVLALVMGLLTASLPFTRHAAAAPPQRSTTVSLPAQGGTPPRLEVFDADGGYIRYQWSDDNGATWSDWARLGDVPGPFNFFNDPPAVVSDGPGRLVVIAMDDENILWENDYISSNSSWSGWLFFAREIYTGDPAIQANHWDFISDPVLTSWGPGRRDLFAYVVNEATGVMRLMHGWGDNSTWALAPELLGTSIDLQGSPAAVSWGPGRIDIFGRDAVNHLAHKWYDANNGGWHDWQDLGGSLTANPAVSSTGVGYLNIFVRNPTGGLSQRSLWPSGWGPWWDLDSNTIDSAPSVAETPGYIHLFALNTSGQLSHKSWTNQWWSPWSEITPASQYDAPTAVTWWPTAVVVPNALSLDQADATTAITQARLVLGSVTQDNTCKAFAGTVLQQDPIGGAFVAIGTAVNLWVSSGLDSKGHKCVFI